MKVVYLAFALSVYAGAVTAEVTGPGIYFVTVTVLEERLEPDPDGSITNRIYTGQKVDVFELKNGWARVSPFYDGEVEGKSGQVARWVLASGLSGSRPPDKPQPKIARDPRIAKDAFPKVGEYGLDATDVAVLNKGAVKLLNSGKCSKVDAGDKSISKKNTYYVTCGGRNVFFTPEDIK